MTPTGAKRWFVKYRFGGKEKRLALDTYPGATFKAAREGGSDPVQVCQAEKLTKAATGATGDEAVSREFHCVKAAGRSEGHATKWLRMNERPHIGSLRLSTIKAPSLLATLRQNDAKGSLSTAQDLLQMAGQVFRYGCGRATVSTIQRVI